MPGTFIFKPIEANLTHNTELIGKMNPYCSLVMGTNRFKGQVCKKGAKHPHWNDVITIPDANEPTALLEVMDQDRITADDEIGHCMIDLQEVQSRGTVSRWYPLSYKNKPAGEILMEAIYQPDPSLINQGSTFGAGAGTALETGLATGLATGVAAETGMLGAQTSTYGAQAGTWQQEQTVATGTGWTEEVAHETSSFRTGGRVFQEQRQFVEPYVFHKQVDVVETRPVLKEVEVTEPVKVLKEVQYTEAVPVLQQIEVTEPLVVTKEVQVMEPRVVTKTIEVVENVPVIKHVDVIEPRTYLKEVETVVPQTFTKTVEVTEQVPVRKTVQVTEPIVVKRDVEFAQPIVTTETITKEIPETIIVDQKITKEVGPATIVRTQETGIVEEIAAWRISNESRIAGQERYVTEQKIIQGPTVGCTTGATTVCTGTTGLAAGTTGFAAGTTGLATGVTGLEERRAIEQTRLIEQERLAGHNVDQDNFARESLIQGGLGNQEPGYTITNQNQYQEDNLAANQPSTSYHPSKKF